MNATKPETAEMRRTEVPEGSSQKSMTTTTEPADSTAPIDMEKTEQENSNLSASLQEKEKIAIHSEKHPMQSGNIRDMHKATSLLTVGSFGPLDSFFWFPGVQGSSWNYLYVEKHAPLIVSGAGVRKWHISWPFSVALSPHGAGYFAYEAAAGGGLVWRFIDIDQKTRPKRRKARVQFDALLESYAKLKRWLTEQVTGPEDIKTVRVVFGPGSRYMAWKPNGPWISHDLPDELQKRLNGGTSNKVLLPWHVTFGLGNSWAALWPDGSQSVELDGKYKELEQVLGGFGSEKITYILLHPCSVLSEYVVTFESVKQRRLTTPQRGAVLGDGFQAQIRQWSSLLGENLAITSDNKEGAVRQIIGPSDAEMASKEQPALRARETELMAEEAAQLSIESSKKSTKASEIAVIAGTIAVLASCSVM